MLALSDEQQWYCDSTLRWGCPRLKVKTCEFPFCLLTSIRSDLLPVTVPIWAAGEAKEKQKHDFLLDSQEPKPSAWYPLIPLFSPSLSSPSPPSLPSEAMIPWTLFIYRIVLDCTGGNFFLNILSPCQGIKGVTSKKVLSDKKCSFDRLRDHYLPSHFYLLHGN